MQKRTSQSIHPRNNCGNCLQAIMLATILIPLSVAVAINLYQHFATQIAPDINFSTLTGEKIALKSLQGKPVLITFWASDCTECLKEIPVFIEIYQKYHSKGLEIIAVAMPYDPPNHVISIHKAWQLPYTIALDMNSEATHAFNDVQLTPTTFLINPAGVIDLKIIGKFDPIELKTHLETLIKG